MCASALTLTGAVFTRLTAMYAVGTNKQGNRLWMCQCECGQTVVVPTNNLRSGQTRSCGCFKRDSVVANKTRHGYASRHTRSTEYRSWHHAKARCCTITDKQYSDYGGRGIRMCERWREDFAAFIADLGEKPTSLHTIDRIDNNGHYSCGQCDECKQHGWTMNCRWATAKQQANNRRKRKKRHQVCVILV